MVANAEANTSHSNLGNLCGIARARSKRGKGLERIRIESGTEYVVEIMNNNLPFALATFFTALLSL